MLVYMSIGKELGKKGTKKPVNCISVKGSAKKLAIV